MRSKLLLIVATIAATASMAPALGAQDTTVSKGEVARAPSFSSLAMAVNTTGSVIEAIKKHGLFKVGEVNLVDASPFISETNEGQLKSALETHAAHTEQLRTAFDSQPVIREMLEKHMPKLTAADVIAADMHADGRLDIYFRTKAS